MESYMGLPRNIYVEYIELYGLSAENVFSSNDLSLIN
jgi:hypothetical protein